MTPREYKKALNRAFNMGQTYWQQADSEYTSQWKKADETMKQYIQFVQDCIEISEEEAAPKKPNPLKISNDMVLASARVMNEISANACGVNTEDLWKLYAEEYMNEARAILAAAFNVDKAPCKET